MNQCENCEYKCDNVELVNHQKVHRYKKNCRFICIYCDQKVYGYEAFNLHLRDHKKLNDKINEKQSARFPNACNLCEFSCSNFSLLYLHFIEQHDCETNTFLCPGCSQPYTNVNSLKSHVYRNHRELTNNDSCTKPNLDYGFKRNVSEKSVFAVPSTSLTFDLIPDTTDTSEPVLSENIKQNNEKSENIVHQIAFLMLKLKSKNGITDEVLQFFINELKNICDAVCLSYNDILDKYSIDPVIKEEIKQNISKKIDFKEISTKYRWEKYFKAHFPVVLPRKIFIGKNKAHKRCHITYVPILENLKSLFSDKSFVKATHYEKNSNDLKFTDFYDGSNFQKSNFFNCNQPRIKLIFYTDAFEACNPIGTSRGVHKLNGNYYTIANLPPESRYNSDNIQLAMIFKDKYLNEFGSDIVYQYLIRDIKELEEYGIDCDISKLTDSPSVSLDHFKSKGSLIAIASDNLGANQIGGFNESFNSEYCCRYCFNSKSDLRKLDCSVKSIRNPLNYNECLNNLNMMGLKKDSAFNALNHFHVAQPGLPPDISHDLFHGVFTSEIHLILEHFVQSKIFTYNDLSCKLAKLAKQFKISLPKVSSKSLLGNMHDIWNLIVTLPIVFVDYNKINRAGNCWELFLSILEITRTVTAFELTKDQVEILKSVQEKYMFYRIKCFPTLNLKPKNHNIMHYADLILLFGPLSKFSTLPYEHKHQFFKFVIEHSKNFINLEYMLAERHQLYQSSLFNDRFAPTIISNKIDRLYHLSLDVIIPEDYNMFSDSVTFKNIKFKINDYVIVSGSSDETVKCMKIQKFVINTVFDKCLIIGRIVHFIYICNYGIYTKYKENENSLQTCYLDKLVYPKPVHVVEKSSTLSYFSPVSLFSNI